MRASHDRSKIAARAAARPDRAVSTSIYTGPLTAPKEYRWTGTRRHGNKASMTGAQRNSQGRMSEWSRSPYEPRGGWR